jgi:hypothetical protein
MGNGGAMLGSAIAALFFDLQFCDRQHPKEYPQASYNLPTENH